MEPIPRSAAATLRQIRASIGGAWIQASSLGDGRAPVHERVLRDGSWECCDAEGNQFLALLVGAEPDVRGRALERMHEALAESEAPLEERLAQALGVAREAQVVAAAVLGLKRSLQGRLCWIGEPSVWRWRSERLEQLVARNSRDAEIGSVFVRVEPGDRLVLCASDHDESLSDPAVRRVLALPAAGLIAQRLQRRARERGTDADSMLQVAVISGPLAAADAPEPPDAAREEPPGAPPAQQPGASPAQKELEPAVSAPAVLAEPAPTAEPVVAAQPTAPAPLAPPADRAAPASAEARPLRVGSPIRRVRAARRRSTVSGIAAATLALGALAVGWWVMQAASERERLRADSRMARATKLEMHAAAAPAQPPAWVEPPPSEPALALERQAATGEPLAPAPVLPDVAAPPPVEEELVVRIDRTELRSDFPAERVEPSPPAPRPSAPRSERARTAPAPAPRRSASATERSSEPAPAAAPLPFTAPAPAVARAQVEAAPAAETPPEKTAPPAPPAPATLLPSPVRARPPVEKPEPEPEIVVSEIPPPRRRVAEAEPAVPPPARVPPVPAPAEVREEPPAEAPAPSEPVVEAEFVAEIVTKIEPDAHDSAAEDAVALAPTPELESPPAPSARAPAAEVQALAPAVRGFLDDWARSIVQADHALYESLGFQESHGRFNRRYRQRKDQELGFDQLAIERAPDGDLRVSVVSRYKFREKRRNELIERREQIVLRETPGGLRYVGDW